MVKSGSAEFEVPEECCRCIKNKSKIVKMGKMEQTILKYLGHGEMMDE